MDLREWDHYDLPGEPVSGYKDTRIAALRATIKRLEGECERLFERNIQASKQRFQDGYMDGRSHACALLALTVYDPDGAALDQEQLIALCAFAEDALTRENP
jgi:hypothetical protein